MAKKKKKKRVDEVVDELVDTVSEILDYRAKLALGSQDLPDNYQYFVDKEQYALIDLARPLIQNSQQARLLKIQSANDIIKLLAKGKCTPSEAKELMELLLLKGDIEALDD